MIGRDERTVAVHDAEAVGIAARGQPGQGFFFEDRLYQGREILFGRIGARFFEEYISLGADRRHGNLMLQKDAVEPSGATAVDGIAAEISVSFCEYIEADKFFELGEISFASINAFEIVFDLLGRKGIVAKAGGSFFDVTGDFRESGTAVSAREFHAVVLRWVVAGGDVDPAVELSIQDGVGEGRSGSSFAAEEDFATLRFENAGRRKGKFFGEKARVVADDQARRLFLCADVAGNGGRDSANAGKSEILGDDAAPAGSSEMNGRSGHGPVL